MKRILELCLIAATIALSIDLPQCTFAQTAALQTGIHVEMAGTTNAAPMPEADNADAWIVTIDNAGTIYFGVKPVNPDQLREEIKTRPRIRQQKLYLKVDARAPFAEVQKVLEAAHVDLFESAVLLTEQSGAPGPATLAAPKGLEVLLLQPESEGRPGLIQVMHSNDKPVLQIDNRQIPWANLDNAVRMILESRGEKIALVKADGTLPFADVVHVIDACHAVGIRTVFGSAEI
jgi:biopolymer transport protein ExbD